MELMVVIAVIALLLAILVPGLGRAREMGGRVVCANNEKQLMLANNLYANNWDEYFCPPMMWNPDMPAGKSPNVNRQYRKHNWVYNPDFRKYMGLDDKQIKKWSLNIMPEEYFCPVDKVARYGKVSQYGVLVSYAYNVSDWNGASSDDSRNLGCYWCDPQGNKPDCAPDCNPTPWMIGHKRTAIPRASEKLAFTDSCDWWCVWDNGANYEEGWDKVGHGNWEKYDEVNVWGPVLYRHNEGANVCFYDGHVEHMAKQKVYIDKGEDAGDPPDRDGTGMWFVIPTWP